MEKPTVQIAFRVPPDIKVALETAAAADDRTLSSLLVRIIKEWLATQRRAGFRKAYNRAVAEKESAGDGSGSV